ncbi:MAG: mannose-1-phosphate guanylyltransferase [Chthoniobacteraceae bacterium]
MPSSSLFVLILAGGSGERFWPLSRKSRPKQLLSLFGDETLLEATLRRLDGLVPKENILILTNADQEAGVRSLARGLPAQNIVAEPAKRDTAAAIALGVGWIAARDPEATMVVLPADHLIRDVEGFQKTVHAAVSTARSTGQLGTIGIKPTWACPGFGYIEMGPAISNGRGPDDPVVHEVVRFREKPDAELAEQFLRQGNFRWNAGMFIWTIQAISAALYSNVPELGAFVRRIHAGENFEQLLRDVFPTLPKISIDYAVMEKAARVFVVESAFDWDDAGSWTAVAKYLADRGSGNSGNTDVTTIESANNIVFSSQKRHVALLGVNDLIVVETPDAILVCNIHEAERIKHLVAKIPPELQ